MVKLAWVNLEKQVDISEESRGASYFANLAKF